MLLHAFWWDVYIVFKKKKRETCAFLSHLIYSFTVYIVNNTASPYVECSIKHFYFNHLVGIFKKKKWQKQTNKKKLMCVSHSPCPVCRITEENFKKGVGTRQRAKQRNECIIHRERLMELTTWMLEREHLLSSY